MSSGAASSYPPRPERGSLFAVRCPSPAPAPRVYPRHDRTLPLRVARLEALRGLTSLAHPIPTRLRQQHGVAGVRSSLCRSAHVDSQVVVLRSYRGPDLAQQVVVREYAPYCARAPSTAVFDRRDFTSLPATVTERREVDAQIAHSTTLSRRSRRSGFAVAMHANASEHSPIEKVCQ